MQHHTSSVLAAGIAAFALLAACESAGSGDRHETPTPAARDHRPGSDLFETRPDGVRVLAPDAGPEAVLLDPGRYAVHLSGSVLAESDIPAGWAVAHAHYFHPPVAADDNGMMFIARAPGKATALPAHPCRDHAYARIGPTVDDLADALAEQPFFEAREPVSTTVGELPALLVELSVPADADLTRCDGNLVSLYRGGHNADGVWFAHPEGADVRLWVLEVFGARYVIHAQWAETRHDAAVLSRIVGSTTFTRG